MKKHFPKELIAGTTLTFVSTHFGGCVRPEILTTRLSEKAQAELLLKLYKLNFRFQPSRQTVHGMASEYFIDHRPGAKPLMADFNTQLVLEF